MHRLLMKSGLKFFSCFCSKNIDYHVVYSLELPSHVYPQFQQKLQSFNFYSQGKNSTSPFFAKYFQEYQTPQNGTRLSAFTGILEHRMTSKRGIC